MATIAEDILVVLTVIISHNGLSHMLCPNQDDATVNMSLSNPIEITL